MVAPGAVLGGDYRIVELLAKGGMGSVYVAEQLSTGRRRALKVMRPDLVMDGRARQRFVEEAQVGGRIDSPHVIEVIGAGFDEATQTPWLAMELLQGESLEARVERRGPLPLGEVAQILAQTCDALGKAHAQGVVHRDLKPENLFVADAATPTAAFTMKVLDFGVAATLAADRTSATATSALGTPLFMAPEQAEAGGKLRPATDVWALGLVAFFALTGKHYWRAAQTEHAHLTALLREMLIDVIDPPSIRAAQLGAQPPPAGFDAWFARCVSRDPGQRFPTGREAGDAFAALASARHAIGIAQTGAPSGGADAHAATMAAFPQVPHTHRPPSGVPDTLRRQPSPMADAYSGPQPTAPMPSGPAATAALPAGSAPGWGASPAPTPAPFAAQPVPKPRGRGCLIAAFAVLAIPVVIGGLGVGYWAAVRSGNADEPTAERDEPTTEEPAPRGHTAPPLEPAAEGEAAPVPEPNPSARVGAPAAPPAAFSWRDHATREWSGQWRAPRSEFHCQLHLTRSGEDVDGHIRWTNQSTHRSGNEYVRGHYQPSSGALRLRGYRVDPGAQLGLDRYRLTIDPDGLVHGRTWNHGRWDGRLRAGPTG